jgi:putative NADH-flavin reductase
MKVALIGASGNGGSRLQAELSRRGHQVTAIARNPDTIAKLPGVTAKKGDVFDKPGLVQLLKGHDAVISAVHFTASDPKLLIEAVKEAGVKRYFVVGGAGSLEVAPGVKLIDTPQFPAAYKAEATKGGEFLELLRVLTRGRAGPSPCPFLAYLVNGTSLADSRGAKSPLLTRKRRGGRRRPPLPAL